MPKKIKSTDASFADQYAELESIVAEFEQSEVNIEEGLQKFERGLQIAATLRKTLNGVENSIEKLKSQYRSTEDSPKDDQSEA